MAFTASLRRKMLSTLERIDSKTHLDPSAQELMDSISATEALSRELSEMISKLYSAQQRHHRYANQLADLLKDTYISTADLDDTFSNPEDPFAAFCKLIGFEVSKFELIEKDYLQNVDQHLIVPLREFQCNEFNDIYLMHSRYKRVLSKTSKSSPGSLSPRGSLSASSSKSKIQKSRFDLNALDHESEEYINKRMHQIMNFLKIPSAARPAMMAMSTTQKIKMIKSHYQKQRESELDPQEVDALYDVEETKKELFREIHRIQCCVNGQVLDHLDVYWRSYCNLQRTKHRILKKSVVSSLRKQEDKKCDEEALLEMDFDIESIDAIVGYNDDSKCDITRYGVKRVTNVTDKKQQKESKRSRRYNRVIYVDSSTDKSIMDDSRRKLKLLSLKKEIVEYLLSDIETVEKSYANLCRLQLKFKDQSEYQYEFETPAKREQFVGQILEYDSKYKVVKTGGKGRTTLGLLSIVIGSFNVSESECLVENIQHWLHPSTEKGHHHDLYVIGLQECKSKQRKQWIQTLLAFIDGDSNQYVVLHTKFLMNIGIILIIHHSHIAKVSHIESQSVATGKGNIIGNKGATAISLQFMESTFCFVNCHLAARAERLTQRAENFARIVKELKMGPLKGVDILHQFQHVFWFGDLNYRIEKDFHEVVDLVEKEKWDEILLYDQLYHAMNFDTVFTGFTEGKISFRPTYRWSKDSQEVSNKRNQPPSYTDRILYRSLPNSLSLWQESYNGCAECLGSDHRPIISVFRLKPRIPYFYYSSTFRRKYSGISISLVELKAKFNLKGVDEDGAMDVIFHFVYSSPMTHRVVGGRYDVQSGYFRFPLIELDDLKIEPFVSDPSFLCTTHVSVTVMQKQVVLGHGVISLLNVFPKSLVDTEKLKREYMATNHQMPTMQEMEIKSNAPNSSTPKVNKTRKGNDKEFTTVISKDGMRVGQLEGFIAVDGTLIRKHKLYSAMDARKQAVSKTPPPPPGRKSRRLKINTQSMFNVFTGKKQKHSKNSDFVQTPPVSVHNRAATVSPKFSTFFK